MARQIQREICRSAVLKSVVYFGIGADNGNRGRSAREVCWRSALTGTAICAADQPELPVELVRRGSALSSVGTWLSKRTGRDGADLFEVVKRRMLPKPSK
jgi:hypothetical protein